MIIGYNGEISDPFNVRTPIKVKFVVIQMLCRLQLHGGLRTASLSCLYCHPLCLVCVVVFGEACVTRVTSKQAENRNSGFVVPLWIVWPCYNGGKKPTCKVFSCRSVKGIHSSASSVGTLDFRYEISALFSSNKSLKYPCEVQYYQQYRPASRVNRGSVRRGATIQPSFVVQLAGGAVHQIHIIVGMLAKFVRILWDR